MQRAGNVEVSDAALAALARCLLPTICSYFASEEGKREFAEWKKNSRHTARSDS
ncbi:hypothetical protein FACS1894120_4250 [Clostridia bacterium]|nr:hypothetical protein FACS1894120_4250 [Clostridia bacterium]